jgi:acyl-CoA reductase-like NAD-dependent aldehyde dehydrogenase
VAVSSDKFPRLLKLAKPVVPEIVVAKPQVYRNDYGAVISEAAWKRLQKMKAEAKEKNYELDEYSQL